MSAHALNPFDPETQKALIRDYTALGQLEDAERHSTLLKIIETGGISALFKE